MRTMQSKSWYSSAGVWGAFVALAGSVLSLLKIEVAPDLLQDIGQWFLSLATLIGGGLALWGAFGPHAASALQAGLLRHEFEARERISPPCQLPPRSMADGSAAPRRHRRACRASARASGDARTIEHGRRRRSANAAAGNSTE